MLGSPEAIRTLISREFPETDWSDPAWGAWEGPTGSIEFSVDVAQPVTCLVLHVRADADVVAPLVRLCRLNGWQGIDTGAGGFLELAEFPESGHAAWRAYRDRVVGDPK